MSIGSNASSSHVTVFSFSGTPYRLSDDSLHLTGIWAIAVVVFSTIVAAWRNGLIFRKVSFDISGWPLIGCRAFFYDIHGFLNEGHKKFGDVFTFKLASYKVFSVRGTEARRLFMYDRNLSFSEGHKALQNVSPVAQEPEIINRDETDGDMAWFHRRNVVVTRRDMLIHQLPSMLKDIEKHLDSWGSDGRYNPWDDDYYRLILKLLLRATVSSEISNSVESVKRTGDLYSGLNDATTFETSFYPFLPTLSHFKKMKCVAQLFFMFKSDAQRRISSGEKVEDPMQALVDRGDNPAVISQFILTTIFAGLLNTIRQSAWLSLYLSQHPTWKTRLTREMRTLIDKHNPTSSSNLSFTERLTQIPFEAWENELPTFEICLKETIRIVMTGALLRKNVGGDMLFNGQKINSGDCLVTNVPDTHMNPDYFREPEKWDPSRFERGEDKKEPYSFVGWGLGRHICPGMRIAQLQIKAFLAFLLLRYEYTLEDSSGAPLKKLPELDRKALPYIPPVSPIFVRYKRILD